MLFWGDVMTVGWVWDRVHSDAQFLLKHACSSGNHPLHLTPYQLHKSLFYSYAEWNVNFHWLNRCRIQSSGRCCSAAFTQESTSPCMCSNFWALSGVTCSFWALFWAGHEECHKDTHAFIYQWGKGSKGKGFVCLLHQQIQQSHECNLMFPRVNIARQVQWQWHGYGLLAMAHQTHAALDTQMVFVA